MKIYNAPPLLTYEERSKLKQARSFTDKHGLIETDNGIWWYCSDAAGAKEYLIKNGAVENVQEKNI